MCRILLRCARRHTFQFANFPLLEGTPPDVPNFSVRQGTHPPVVPIFRLLEGGSPEPPKRCVRRQILQSAKFVFRRVRRHALQLSDRRPQGATLPATPLNDRRRQAATLPT